MPSHTVIYGRSEKRDENVYPIEIDAYTGALQTIDVSHHHVHESDSFAYVDSIVLASAAVQDYLITTPDSEYWTNMLSEIVGTLSFTLAFFEATDKAGVTLQTPFNRNRNSTRASRTLIHKTLNGGSTDGTLLSTETVGTTTGAGIIGGSSRNEEEILLKRNTKYILRITSNANANRINLKLHYYEHPQFFEE